jgi:hypothetical protein
MGCCSSAAADPAQSRQVPETRCRKDEEDLLKKRNQAEGVLKSFIDSLPEDQKQHWRKEKEKQRHNRVSQAMAWFRNSRGSVMSENHRRSQDYFRERSQTLIIFDWDDTIFPTHWFKQERKAAKTKNKPLSQDDGRILEELCTAVIELINLSMEVGHPVMITNARRPWVDLSSWKVFKNPSLTKVLKDVPILYATEFVDLKNTPQDVEELKKSLAAKGHDFENSSKEEADQAISAAFLTQTKAKAMKEALTAFYASYEKQSWKNIVTLGDAHFEHDAIKKVVEERPEHMQGKRCRVKTMKFIEAPTLEGILNEVRIATRWISKICDLDDCVDIDMGSGALEEMMQFDSTFGTSLDCRHSLMTEMSDSGSRGVTPIVSKDTANSRNRM